MIRTTSIIDLNQLLEQYFINQLNEKVIFDNIRDTVTKWNEIRTQIAKDPFKNIFNYFECLKLTKMFYKFQSEQKSQFSAQFIWSEQQNDQEVIYKGDLKIELQSLFYNIAILLYQEGNSKESKNHHICYQKAIFALCGYQKWEGENSKEIITLIHNIKTNLLVYAAQNIIKNIHYEKKSELYNEASQVQQNLFNQYQDTSAKELSIYYAILAYYQLALGYDPNTQTHYKVQGIMAKALKCLNASLQLVQELKNKEFLKIKETIIQTQKDFIKRNKEIYKEKEFQDEIPLPEFKLDEQIEDVLYLQPIEETIYSPNENVFNFTGTLEQQSTFQVQNKREFVEKFFQQTLILEQQKSSKNQFISFSQKGLMESKIINDNGEDEIKESNGFQDAILISMLDRQFKKENLVQQQNQKEEFASMQIQNGQRQSVVFFYDRENASPENIQNSLGLDGIQMQFSIVDGKKQNKLPTKQGFLLKKSPHYLQGWQQRYCVLENKILRYYLSDKDKNIFGIINFDIVSYNLSENTDKKGNLLDFMIKPIKVSQKEFIFKASTPEETRIWYDLIKLHYETSEGKAKQLVFLCQTPRYWRVIQSNFDLIYTFQNEITHQKQVYDSVENGDLVLFKGKDVNSSLQRAFTGADYDHVGIFLKLEDSLQIFEATNQYGVGLCPWNSMIKHKWYNLYEKMVYRNLEIERDEQFIKKLEEFVQQNMGKKYSLTMNKLLKFKSTILTVEQEQKKNQKKEGKKEERTFFCSELVAALYKSLGLLPQNVSTTQYWPGSFSSKKQLKLLKGSLSEEYLIDFME